MTLHFMHIGKTGGTAIKRSLTDNRLAFWRERGRHKVPETPWGPIKLHTHRFRMGDLPDGEHVFFCVRDPVARFVSAFYSRHRQGGEAYGHRFPWSEAEQQAFATFSTPQQLALALGSTDAEERELARWTMGKIRHLGFQQRFTGQPTSLQLRLGRIVFIARQETLEADWEQLKPLLGLPDVELVSDAARAHRRDRSKDDAPLDDAAVRNLREWYARDYRLLDYIDALRMERGWGPAAQRKRFARKLRGRAGRARRLITDLPRRAASRS